jgi:hypothetical protein
MSSPPASSTRGPVSDSGTPTAASTDESCAAFRAAEGSNLELTSQATWEDRLALVAQYDQVSVQERQELLTAVLGLARGGAHLAGDRRVPHTPSFQTPQPLRHPRHTRSTARINHTSLRSRFRQETTMATFLFVHNGGEGVGENLSKAERQSHKRA